MTFFFLNVNINVFINFIYLFIKDLLNSKLQIISIIQFVTKISMIRSKNKLLVHLGSYAVLYVNGPLLHKPE